MNLQKIELLVTQTNGDIENPTPLQWSGKSLFTHECYNIKLMGDSYLVFVNDFYDSVYSSFEEAEQRINIIHGVSTRKVYGSLINSLLCFLAENKASKIVINSTHASASIKGYY